MITCDENPMDRPVRVLVVEDDFDDGDLLVRQLHKNNCEGHVKVIPDGGEAWNFLMAKDSCASLVAIFLDLNLPSVSGMKLLRKIKSRVELCTTPVFVMTSSNRPQDLNECSRLGVDGYIAKPVTYLAFAQAVAGLFHSPLARGYARVE
jgi:two-component system response regulator